MVWNSDCLESGCDRDSWPFLRYAYLTFAQEVKPFLRTGSSLLMSSVHYSLDDGHLTDRSTWNGTLAKDCLQTPNATLTNRRHLKESTPVCCGKSLPTCVQSEGARYLLRTTATNRLLRATLCTLTPGLTSWLPWKSGKINALTSRDLSMTSPDCSRLVVENASISPSRSLRAPHSMSLRWRKSRASLRTSRQRADWSMRRSPV